MSNHAFYANKLQDKLDKDLSWRKKEIIDYSLLVESQMGDTQITLIRAAIPLLYAHWEGFIKNTSIHYLKYICKMNLQLSELTENFCHISLGKKFEKSTSVHTYSSQKALFDYIYHELEEATFWVNSEVTIDTKCNLKFDVFQVIVNQLGVDGSWYETKRNFINETLLGRRNAIAHGEYKRDTNLDGYIVIKDNVLEFLEFFKNLILEAFVQKKFLRRSLEENRVE